MDTMNTMANNSIYNDSRKDQNYFNEAYNFTGSYEDDDNVTVTLPGSVNAPLTLDAILSLLLLGPIILIVIFGNAMVILAVVKDRTLKQSLQNRFILSLAFADMCIGTFIMPLSLHMEVLKRWALGKVLCNIWLALDVFLCTGSTLSLVVVSVDRYWSVTKALEYPQIRTSKKVNIAIAGIWITSGVVSVPPLAGWASNTSTGDPEQCNLVDELGYIIYSLTISFYIPIIIILIAYGRIFQVARRRANQHIRLGTIQNIQTHRPKQMDAVDKPTESTDQSLTTNSSNQPISEAEEPISTKPEAASAEECNNSNGSKRGRKFTIFASRFMHRQYSKSRDQQDTKQAEGLLKEQQQNSRKMHQKYQRERRATITIAIIVMAFIICWFPFSIIYLIDRLCLCGLKDSKAFLVIFWLGYCNSAVNPVLYSIFNRDFRLAFKRLLCRRQRR